MKNLILFICVFISPSVFSQVPDLGSTTATLNQVHPDPAQRQFEREYDELQQEMENLDEGSGEEECRPDKKSETCEHDSSKQRAGEALQ